MQINKTAPVFSMAAMIGECLDDYHPEWTDHFLILFTDTKGESYQQWFPSVLGLEIRRHDWVVLCKPINWSVPIITGILPPVSSPKSFFSPWGAPPSPDSLSPQAQPTIHDGPFKTTDDQKRDDKNQKYLRASFELRPNNTIALTGETPIQVVTHNGRKLVEIGLGKDGPTIRICERDATIDLPGKLSITAGELHLTSRSGDLKINADHDVVVRGDLIRLN